MSAPIPSGCCAGKRTEDEREDRARNLALPIVTTTDQVGQYSIDQSQEQHKLVDKEKEFDASGNDSDEDSIFVVDLRSQKCSKPSKNPAWDTEEEILDDESKILNILNSSMIKYIEMDWPEMYSMIVVFDMKDWS